MQDIKLFSGTNSRYLSDKIADYYGYNLGNCDVKKFSDGEMQIVINESVRGVPLFYCSQDGISFRWSRQDNRIVLRMEIKKARSCTPNLLETICGFSFIIWLRNDKLDRVSARQNIQLLLPS